MYELDAVQKGPSNTESQLTTHTTFVLTKEDVGNDLKQLNI